MDRPVLSGSAARRPVALLDTSDPPPARAPLSADYGTALGDPVDIFELSAVEGAFVVEPAAIRARIGRRNHVFMLCALMISLALCIGAAVMWSPPEGTPVSRIIAGAGESDPSIALPLPASHPEIVTTRPSGHTSQGASFVVLLPTEADYLVGPTIPVAGYAFRRRHGVSISSVVVRLVVRDRVVAQTVLPVHRGRFAGTLHVGTIRERIAAELEVARAASPGVQVIRHLLVDPHDR
jgi:hypothetical protein